VLNAANEVAVAAFLDRRIAFLDIAAIVEETMERYDPAAPGAIDDVIEIDREARHEADEAMKVFVD
jgi:1-deoxy-D-xylulose-5-phosphate reductoisomerase